MTPEIMLSRIKSAQEKVDEKIFDEDQASLGEVVTSLIDVNSTATSFAGVALPLATVLRKLGNGLQEKNKNGESLFNQAQQVLNKSFTWYADDAKLLNEQGHLYDDTKQYDQAFASFEKVIKKQPQSDVDRVYAFENAAASLRKRGKELSDTGENCNAVFKRAEQVLNDGLTSYADSVNLLNERGNLYYAWQHFDQALESFKEVINQAGADAADKVYALERAGASQRELREFTNANEMFSQAVALAGLASVSLLIERGWLRFYQGLYEQALKDFTEVQGRVEVTKENKHEVMAGQIACYQALDSLNPADKQDRAKAVVQGWLSRKTFSHEEAARILFRCDEVHTLLNLYPAALLNYDLLLEGPDWPGVAPKDCKSWRIKIAGLKWLRRFKEAEDLYKLAQAEFPSDLDLWWEMGQIHYQQKRYAEAHSYFSGKAIDDPDNSLQKNDPDFRERLVADKDAIEWTIVSLRKMRNLKEARKKVDEALAQSGDNIGFLCEKAAIDYAEREYAHAIELFDRALQIDGYYEFALQWRAASHRKTPEMVKASAEPDARPDFARARTAIDEALGKLPFGTGLLEERGWLAFDMGDLELAGEYFDKSNKLDPYVMIQRQFSRIEIFARLKFWDKALAVFDHLDQQFPGDAEITEQRCWFYLRRGLLEQARQQCEVLEELHPGNVLGINARGGYELEHRNYAIAAEYFSKAIEKCDYEPQYHINLAWALLRQLKEPGEMKSAELPFRAELLDRARKSCLTALELDPYNSKAYGCLGVIAFKQNSYLDAEVYFRKSIELSAEEGSYVELASLYGQIGRFEEAEKILKEAVRLNKDDARVYIEWGNIFVMTKKNEEAVGKCREAVVTDPNNEEAHRALAIALMRADRFDEAELTIRKALRVVPRSRQWQLYLLLSQVSVRLGDAANKDRKKKDRRVYDEALRYVDEARRDNPWPNADIFFHAGIVQYKRANYQAAHRHFADCVKANRDRFEADRYGSIVHAVIEQEKRLFSVNKWYGIFLSIICVALLGLLWVLYYTGDTRTVLLDEKAAATAPASPAGATPPAAGGPANNAAELTDKRQPHDEFTVDSSLLTVMTPILLGLLAVAALLPNLNKLKLPGGFEAEILEAKTEESDISSGPQGDIGFGSSLPIISPEPR